MKVLVLGAGAGGGFPQWNCACALCEGARSGAVAATSRTQSSIAVSADGIDWVLVNASPDLGQQLRQTPALHPRGTVAGGALRHTPIKAVVLMDAQLDHVSGLLSLREGPPLPLYCTPAVFDDLTGAFPLLTVLDHYCGVRWHMLPVAGETASVDFEIPAAAPLRFSAVAIRSKAPPYSPRRNDPEAGDNIALFIEDPRSGERLFYAPGLGAVNPEVAPWMQRASCMLVDGTFWRDDEMRAAGLGHQSAADMGHLALHGERGMLAALRPLRAHRKVLVHVNNSNPILDAHSAERRELARHGVEVAYDGMEIHL